jgi:hypothetical protein
MLGVRHRGVLRVLLDRRIEVGCELAEHARDFISRGVPEVLRKRFARNALFVGLGHQAQDDVVALARKRCDE